MSFKTLHLYFDQSVENYPTHRAIEMEGSAYSYQELSDKADKIKWQILSCHTSIPFIGLLTHRSISSYAGLLGILKSGRAYMPLNVKYPIERSFKMMEMAGVDTIVVGDECLVYLHDLLMIQGAKKLAIILPETKKGDVNLPNQFEQHIFIFKDEIPATVFLEKKVEEWAYLLFTSGSTGFPKGVPITHGNASAYIAYILSQFSFSPQDRFSQFFDLSFDPSVHDLFVCWAVGGCLCVLPDEQLFSPAYFIQKRKVSVWYSVPSVIAMMGQMRVLKENAFVTLRYSFFSAESLGKEAAKKWQLAAPSATIVNLYGPTEVTVNCSAYRWDKQTSERHCLHDKVPIGQIFHTHQYCIVDEGGNQVKQMEEGELCVQGVQVFRGYLNNNIQSASVLQVDSKGNYWYKTGDIVKEDDQKNLHFLGRKDDQVKIKGYRIELEELNLCIKKFVHHDQVITLCIENIGLKTKYLITFICDITSNNKPAYIEEIQKHCRQYLPDYMIPRDIVIVEQFPLLVNGKINKAALLKLVEV